MKIVHCSDLHLGKRVSGSREFSQKRYLDFFKAFENFIEKVENLKPDICIIAGDIFDKKEINPDVLEKAELLFKRLREAVKIDIIAIEGNHDNSQNLEESWLEYLQTQKLIKVFYFSKDSREENYLKIEDINFYPIGYPGHLIEERLTNLAKNLREDEKNIVIVHTGISYDGNTLPGCISKETLELFKGKVIYMAGGHIHSFATYPKEEPYFFVSGSLEFSNIQNESSDRKGFIYFDTESREYEFIEVEHRKRLRKSFAYSNFENLELEFENFISELNLSQEEILIVDMAIKNNDYINTENLEKIASDRGIFKTYILIKSIQNIGIENKNSADLTIEEIEKNLISSWNISNKEKIVENFTSLKYFFENDDEGGFLNLFDNLLEVNGNDN